MLNNEYFDKIKKVLLEYAEKRREIIKMSDDALHRSKQAIFALHRDELEIANNLLQEVENILSAVEKKQECDSGLTKEGAYNAGLEEYTEAYLFRQFLVGEELSEVKKISVKPNIFVGGLADVPGELYRYAIKSATVRDVVMVKKCQSVSEEIIKAMLDMNLTGYNRQKFDQAKQALSKIEKVVYELSLRD